MLLQHTNRVLNMPYCKVTRDKNNKSLAGNSVKFNVDCSRIFSTSCGLHVHYLRPVFITLLLIWCGARVFAQTEKSVNISGTVREQGSLEAIVAGSVRLFTGTVQSGVKPVRGAYTNKYGFYTLKDVVPGSYTMVVSSVGLTSDTLSITVAGTEDIKRDFSLRMGTRREQDIVVVADREVAAIQKISTIAITPAFIKDMPALGGEVDVFRVLQLLPGVKSSSEISSGLYVRGGSPDQNLTLLDGVVVYNPAHLGGFLSTFHNDALRDIRLIKGGMPSEYGGRIGSVLDISMKEGNAEKVKGTLHLSLLSAGGSVEGPIDSASTFMISARRFYLDIFTALFIPAEDGDLGYSFYDLNLKVNRILDDNNRIYLSGYFGRDVFSSSSDGDASDVRWGNSTANLRWTHIWGSDLFSNTSLIYTDYVFGLGFSNENQGFNSSFSSDSRIRDFTVRSEFQYTPADNHQVKTGLEITHHDFTSVAVANAEIDEEFLGNQGSIKAVDASLFLQDEWRVTEEITTNIGARAYWFQQGNYLRFEPRINASYALNSTTTLTGSFIIAHQFLHLITRNDITLPTDLWFPSTTNVLPSKGTQTILGMQTTVFNDWLFTVEGYYKAMQNLYEYKEDAEFTLGTPIESQFTRGTGKAYGVEFFLQKRYGDFTGWIGYTLSWTNRVFPELNNGVEFPTRYDRRHDISITGTYTLGKSWRFGGSFVFGTGQAYTVPSGQYTLEGLGGGFNGDRSLQDLYTTRNGYRLAPFHKLDVNFIHMFTMFGLPAELSLNVYNVYNRRNPFAVYTDYQYDRNSGESKRVVKQITLFPIIPSVGLRWTF